MKTFDIRFLAKKRGALGTREEFTRKVTATNYNAALISLYDDFDHVSVLFVHTIDEPPPPSEECSHGDVDDLQCLDCGKDLTEDYMAKAFDRMKAKRYDGDY